MMKTTNTYLRGMALATSALILGACAKPYATGAPHDIATAGPVDCFPTKAAIEDTNLGKNKTAIFIGLGQEGQILVGYPNEALQNTIDGLRTKAQLADVVATATAEQMVYYPTSERRPNLPNPLNLRTLSNTSVAFRLDPKAWDFAKSGFQLKAKNIAKGRFSPFTTTLQTGEKISSPVAIVDVDRNELVPQSECVYKYELLAAITSTNKGLTSRLPIILDPDWGLEPPPSPPGGNP